MINFSGALYKRKNDDHPKAGGISMDRYFHFIIDACDAGSTVAAFCASRNFSRRLIIRLRKSPEYIRINGNSAFTTAVLSAGDVLDLHVAEDPPSEKLVPTEMPLSILYEDEDLCVVDKPADMPVHLSMGNYSRTVANACAWYYRQEKTPFIFRAVNRLDRDTTGAMIVAKNPFAAAACGPAAQVHRIQTEYLAIVEGIPPAEGTVDAPIARESGSVMLRRVSPGAGDRAVTHFTRLAVRELSDAEGNQTFSLILLTPETGRTHQIRVHMKALGFPLPGDYLYCRDYRFFARSPLHAWRLTFPLPVDSRPLTVTAPVPEDMRMAFPEYFDFQFFQEK